MEESGKFGYLFLNRREVRLRIFMDKLCFEVAESIKRISISRMFVTSFPKEVM